VNWELEPDERLSRARRHKVNLLAGRRSSSHGGKESCELQPPPQDGL